MSRDTLRGILGDSLGEGSCESKIVVRQFLTCETSRCLAWPSGDLSPSQVLDSWREGQPHKNSEERIWVFFVPDFLGGFRVGGPIRQKLRGSFYRGWCEFPLVSLEERLGVGFPVGGGGGFPVESKGKGEGGGEGGGWGGDRQRNRQVNTQALSKLPFSKLPFGVSPVPSPFLGDFLKDFSGFLVLCSADGVADLKRRAQVLTADPRNLLVWSSETLKPGKNEKKTYEQNTKSLTPGWASKIRTKLQNIRNWPRSDLF